jgi:hypothetical protein
MMRQLFRFPLIIFLIFTAALLVSTFIVFFVTPLAVYPPPGTFHFVGDRDSGYVSASPGEHYFRGSVGQFFLGKHYRSLWTSPVTLPVLVLKDRNLKVAKKGGGMQTTSFTLTRSDGKEFLLRSVDKDTKNVLPASLQNTLVASFVRDQISATDPYAFLVVAALARNAGIYQAVPEMVYIMPHDPEFQNFGHIQGFYMYFPKELPNLDLSSREKYLATYPTPELQKLTRSGRPTLKLDTLAYLKCRLFDLLISDWDRHPGQWDWLTFSVKNDTVFRPSPKDRDQAMGYYQDGVLPWLLTRQFVVRKITSFTHNYEDMKGALQNGSVLDKIYLKNLPEAKFISVANQLKTSLTDKVIKEAIKEYPPEIRNKIAPQAYSKLVSRRNKLPEAAKGFYDVLHDDQED